MSVSWEKPRVPWDSGFCVIFSDWDPDDEVTEQGGVVCMDCLLDDGGEQLGRGMDLARAAGQADYDVESGGWYVPTAERHWATLDQGDPCTTNVPDDFS